MRERRETERERGMKKQESFSSARMDFYICNHAQVCVCVCQCNVCVE